MVSWFPGKTLEAVEREVIESAYRFHQQNKTMTAQSLGIAIRTLDNKLEKYAADDGASATAREVERKKDDTLSIARRPYGAEPVKEVPQERSLPLREEAQIQKLPHAAHGVSGKRHRG